MSWEEMQKVVKFLFKKYFSQYRSFKDDLISCGYIGICKAQKKFDASKGVKFLDYAYPCIINEMRRFLSKELKHYNNRIDDIDKVKDIIPDAPELIMAEYDMPINEKDRELIKMLYEGYSFSEIGRERGVSYYSVSKRIKRIQNRCKAQLEADNEKISL